MTATTTATTRHGEACRTLRVVSWNVGLRGLRGVCDPASAAKRGAPDTHGVCRNLSFGNLKTLLASLDADVVCLQVCVCVCKAAGPQTPKTLLTSVVCRERGHPPFHAPNRLRAVPQH